MFFLSSAHASRILRRIYKYSYGIYARKSISTYKIKH